MSHFFPHLYLLLQISSKKRERVDSNYIWCSLGLLHGIYEHNIKFLLIERSKLENTTLFSLQI